MRAPVVGIEMECCKSRILRSEVLLNNVTEGWAVAHCLFESKRIEEIAEQ